MSNKRVKTVIVAVVIIIFAVITCWYIFGRGNSKNSGRRVYVSSVGEITGTKGAVLNRFSGIVEPQETLEIKKNSEKTVKQLFVEAGQNVTAGTELFSYDTDELNTKLDQAKLDLDRIANDITSSKEQINTLTSEKANAPAEEQFQYTSQIQELQLTIKKSEYEQKSKQVEINELLDSIANAVVTSEIDGVIKSINEKGVDSYGQEAAYITILTTGDYRVKGTISEQNVYQITQGANVIIRSRVNNEQTWTGVINKIDTESPESNSSDQKFINDNQVEKSSKYPFYITMNNVDGLMLGQHVFIEMDEGQQEKKEGIWLFSGYINQEGENAYIWASSKDGKLIKKEVTLGEYDENLDEYEIVSGLNTADYIAWPEDYFTEGFSTTTNMEDTMVRGIPK